MKYKIGDKVRIRNKEWYDKHKDECGNIRGAFFDKDRVRFCGTIQTIASDGYITGSGIIIYPIEDAYEFIGEEAIEGLAEFTDDRLFEIAKNAWDKVDEEMDALDKKIRAYYDGEQWSSVFECPEGCVFKDENGNVINATKIVLEKKKKEYPKTFYHCVRTLGLYSHPADDSKYKTELIHKLQTLLVCRDAYWKITGEEMGLGKPWKPDWTELSCKYIILSKRGKIIKGVGIDRDTILTFPTAEMRDAFYENFKDLIEQCKELL